MKTQQAIDLAGSANALSKLLKITPGAVSQWGEDVPDKRIWQLKVLRPKWFKKSAPDWDGTTDRRIQAIKRRAGLPDRRNTQTGA
jgi:hypothetical protein